MSFSVIPVQRIPSLRHQDSCIIIDLRAREEYVKSHVEGAINIPYDEWEEKPPTNFPQKTLIFYCKRGNQSMLAAKEMSQKGYQALSIAGGYQSYLVWKKKGRT